MLKAHYVADGAFGSVEVRDAASLPPEAVWLDLLEPTAEDEALVERLLGVEVPTREEMKEIEASSRLYRDGDAAFMTATLVVKADTELPESSVVTFILTTDRLITVRYADPMPFRTYLTHASRHPSTCVNAEGVFGGLLEAIVDRLADVLEAIGAELESTSREIFTHSRTRARRDFQKLLGRIGRAGDLDSKARESLVSLGRLLAFAIQGSQAGSRKAMSARLKAIARDVASLSDHSSFLNNKVNFLLDATLGLINIEQNAIIKIFSVAAVVFLPPTLIASIYGMNFEVMPELGWWWGYPMALGMMIVSAVLPYLYFKRRGWL